MNIGSTLPLADTWGMHGDIGTGWWIVMVVAMVVFWGAVIVGGIWLLRGALAGSQRQRKESPSDILERRFAEGAISVEDYRERREVLTSGTSSAEAAGGDERQVAPGTRGRSER